MKLISPICAVALAGCVAPVEERDIVYDTRHTSSVLDIYAPDDGALAHPTVMFIHGGSWRFGDKDHFTAAGRRLARSGYVVASIDYRLLPYGVFPNNLLDATCALAYLRAHAAEHAIDPDRIVVMGYSAGAHLASLVGLASDHPELLADCEAAAGAPVAPPVAVISASGPQDMRTFWDEMDDKSAVEDIFGGSPDDLPHAYELGSPRFHVRAGAPPFLIVEDAIDFGGIEDMSDALAEVGVPVRRLQIAGSLHILEQHADPGIYEAGMATEVPEAWIAIQSFLAQTVGAP